MCTNLLVIGASARALAVSAVRLGFKVNAIDLFGDRDLRDVCSRVVQVAAPAYPNELPRIAAEFPAGPVGSKLMGYPTVRIIPGVYCCLRLQSVVSRFIKAYVAGWTPLFTAFYFSRAILH